MHPPGQRLTLAACSLFWLRIDSGPDATLRYLSGPEWIFGFALAVVAGYLLGR